MLDKDQPGEPGPTADRLEDGVTNANSVASTSFLRGRFALLAALAVFVMIAWGVYTAIDRAREAAFFVHCNLGQIALAMALYEDEHGRLPPAVVYDPQGRPLYGWRVLLLPYIEEQELYADFHLDEPWDSEHNIKLLARTPTLYKVDYARWVDVPPTHTVYRVFVGPQTLFNPARATRLADFSENDTLLFVEAGEPIPWSKPDEVEYQPDRAIRLSGLFRGGAYRAYSTKSKYRLIDTSVSQEELHNLIQIRVDGVSEFEETR